VNTLNWRVLTIIGFLLAQAVIVYTFYETQRQTLRIETIRLARDLHREFYVEVGVYKTLRNTIESCGPIYVSWGGKFNHDQINVYLGFFEDLGFYLKGGYLDEAIINHFYGAYVVEAAENPDIKRYVNAMRGNEERSEVFENFLYLDRRLRANPELAALSAQYAKMCVSKGGPDESSTPAAPDSNSAETKSAP